MKNYGNQILSIILTFIVTLLLNVGIEQFFKSIGSIQIETIQLSSGSNIALIRIENYSNGPINGLQLLIPKESRIDEVSSSMPINIEEGLLALSTTKQKLIKLSLIPPKAISTTLIPLPLNSNCCSILNSEELKIVVKKETDILNPSIQAFYKGLQTSIIYTIIFTFVVFWHKARINELSDRIERIEEKYDDYVEKTNKKLQEVESKFGRHKILLLRRLSDYSKELEFWRDTIRKVLYQSDFSTSHATAFIEHVTNKLGTFGTRSSSVHEFETINALAKDVLEHEKKSNK